MFEGFKKFILKGNVVDMSTGIMIGAAFTTLVKSLVTDIMSPPLGLIIDNIDFSDLFITLRNGVPLPPYKSLVMAQNAGAITLNYGLFLNALMTFFITGFVLYFVIHKLMALHKREEFKISRKKGPEEKVLLEIRDLLAKEK